LSQGKSPLQRQYPHQPHSGLQKCPTEPGAVMHLLDTGAQNFTSVVHRASPVVHQQPSDLACGLPLLQSPHKTSVGSDTLLSNLTATFDEKLRLLLDPHYQSTGGGDPVSSNPTTDPPQPLVRNTPLKMDSNRQVAMPLKQQRSRSLQQHQNQAELAKDCEVLTSSNNRLVGGRPAVELKRGRLVDKTKEKPVRPFLRGHSASNILINNTGGQEGGLGLSANNSSTPGFVNLRRNNSLSKEEKQELNIRKQQEQMSAADEKENEDNRNLLRMVVAGTDPGSVAKYRKTMNNQKRRIRRRHTVGGTKDFAEWETVINAENEAKRSALRMAATTQGHDDPNVQFCVGMAPISLEKTQVYAEESIAEAFRSAAARGHMGRGGTGLGGDQIGAEIAAVEAAASRIIQRCSVQQDCGSPGVSGLYGQSWRTSSPDLVVLSNTGGMVLPPATKPSPSQHQQGSEKPNKVLKKIDRRFSLPESAMISPDEETDDETGGTKIKPFPSLLESQV